MHRSFESGSRFFRVLVRVAWWRLTEIAREPTALFWVFGFPQLILIVLGVTFTDRPPETLRIDFLNRSQQPASERLRDKLIADRRIILNQPIEESIDDAVEIAADAAVQKRLQSVQSSLIVAVRPPVDSEDRWPQFQLIFDPDRPDSVHARAVVEAHIAALASDAPQVTVTARRSIGGRYVDFLVPGLLAVGTMGASLVLFGYGLVELRMLGLLRVLLATPLSTFELLAGMLLARCVLLIPEVGFVLLTGWLLFGIIPASGTLAVFLISAAGAFQFAAIGFWIGARGQKLESASGWVSLLMLTQWVFCGVFFAREVLPAAWAPWLRWLPLSLLVDATRGLMQFGDPPHLLYPSLGGMAAWGAIGILAGSFRFRAD